MLLARYSYAVGAYPELSMMTITGSKDYIGQEHAYCIAQ